jgi:hypothetical protein
VVAALDELRAGVLPLRGCWYNPAGREGTDQDLVFNIFSDCRNQCRQAPACSGPNKYAKCVLFDGDLGRATWSTDGRRVGFGSVALRLRPQRKRLPGGCAVAIGRTETWQRVKGPSARLGEGEDGEVVAKPAEVDISRCGQRPESAAPAALPSRGSGGRSRAPGRK